MNHTYSSVLERRTLPSSRPGHKPYPMIRTRSGWQHEGALCERAFFQPGEPCRHVKECNQMVNQDAPMTQEVVLRSEGFAVEEFASDLNQQSLALLQKASVDVIDTWCYSFNPGDGPVTDLSIKGVQAVAREMAKKGEIVKVVDVQVVAEDDDEIRIIATAVREVLRVVDGQVLRIELDRCTRGKRQPKTQTVNEYTGEGQSRRRTGRTFEKADKFWYEKAVSKGVRNAMAPLLGGETRAQVLSLWRAAQIQLGHQRAILPAARPANLQLGAGGNTKTTAPAAASQAAPASPPLPKQPPEEADVLPVTPALRQQLNRKVADIVNSWGNEVPKFMSDLYAKFPELKPLQGAGRTIVLNKVQTIGKAKEISGWIDQRTGNVPPDDADDAGLEGAQGDAAAREDVQQTLLAEQCDHPDDALQAHPTQENTYVCGKCGEVIEVSDEG